jgi:hypothetical protein
MLSAASPVYSDEKEQPYNIHEVSVSCSSFKTEVVAGRETSIHTKLLFVAESFKKRM